MSSQYFFRFGSKKNFLFHKFYEIKNGQLVYRPGYEHHESKGHVLAFYYDQFRSLDVYDHFDKKKKNPMIKKAASTTAKAFLRAQSGDVFWIFLDDHIAAFEYQDGMIFDADEFNDGDTPAKCRYFKFLNIYEKSQLPDLFSTTDSCIMSTIQNLHTADKAENKKVAEVLLSLGKKKIPVASPAEALRYLSPTQLESVFFILLHNNGYIVSSHRGGSKARIDLEIIRAFSSKLKTLFVGKARIQVKRTATADVAQNFLNDGIYFVTLDEKLDAQFHGHPYFIGMSKLKDFFVTEKTKTRSTLIWLKYNLGKKKYFEFAF